MKNVLRAQAAAEGFNPSNPEDSPVRRDYPFPEQTDRGEKEGEETRRKMERNPPLKSPPGKLRQEEEEKKVDKKGERKRRKSRRKKRC